MPQIPVQGPVLDCFQDIRRPNIPSLCEIGNCACDLENSIVSPRAEMKLFHSPTKEFPTPWVEFAMRLELTVRHLAPMASSIA